MKPGYGVAFNGRHCCIRCEEIRKLCIFNMEMVEETVVQFSPVDMGVKWAGAHL
jgi:hypothetical protein